MFTPKYYLTVHDANKGIVSFKMTGRTKFVIIAANLIPLAVMAGLAALATVKDERDSLTEDTTIDFPQYN